jgi:eukaryotic-like serine/threonine-protein kinase
MTPERWQQIRDLLERAMELGPGERAGLLDRSCASDPSLRHEVEILLASSDDVRSSFMQSQPPRAALVTGTRLGEYEIKSLLGAGGMGEVYRAHDSRLGRDIAIKVLPSFVVSNADRLRRFEQEARAAAALNHPNILAVYQLGTHAGAPYLVSELLEGETLRERLKRGRLALRRVIDYGVQIARGLSAAHEKGIVHRDLKPENLFVTKDGRVKILDFGLARLTQGLPGSEHSALTAGSETEPGAVMGTVGYMSPEQVRGQTADHRTDIFSFGAILYEMLAGKRAFQKPTSAETMSAILNEEPPSISQVTENLSPAMQRVVHRCLEKNPEQRFQSASDLAFALDALSETASASSAGVPKATSRKIPKVWPATVAFVLVVIAVGSFTFFSQPKPPKLGRGTQLTHDGTPKMVLTRALVTDGARLYFDENTGGGETITEVSTSGGTTSPIPTTLPDIGLYDISPTGSELLVNSGDSPHDNPLWLLPLPTGAPRRLGNISASEAAWSPDGKQIAYIKWPSGLFLADADGTNARKLLSLETVIPRGHLVNIMFSPDGERIRFSAWNAQSKKSSFWDVNVDGSKLRRALAEEEDSRIWKWLGTWTSDSKYFIFSAGNHKESNLWAMRDCPHFYFWCRSEPIQLTNGPLRLVTPSVSKDGKHLFAGGGLWLGQLVRYDPRSSQFSPFLSGPSLYNLEFSPDGKWVAWNSYPEETLWLAKADGTDARELTHNPLLVEYPHWSHDGHRIVFAGLHLGQEQRIYTLDMNSGVVEPLPGMYYEIYDITWAPNDSALIFASSDPAENFVIKMQDLGTGKVTDLSAPQNVRYPLCSPDGRFLLTTAKDNHHLWLMEFSSGKWSEVPHTWDVGNTYFSHDSKSVYLEDDTDNTIYRYGVLDGKVQRVVTLKDLRRPNTAGPWFGLAPDDSILATRDLGTHEIYAFDLEK